MARHLLRVAIFGSVQRATWTEFRLVGWMITGEQFALASIAAGVRLKLNDRAGRLRWLRSAPGLGQSSVRGRSCGCEAALPPLRPKHALEPRSLPDIACAVHAGSARGSCYGPLVRARVSTGLQTLYERAAVDQRQEQMLLSVRCMEQGKKSESEVIILNTSKKVSLPYVL